MRETELVLQCPTCYGTKFRLSQRRLEDIFYLLLLRYPVRCRKCSARVYVDRAFANALKARRAASLRSRESAKADSAAR